MGVCSDSLGSIRIPSSFNGIFAFKPTGLRMSKRGRVGVSGKEVEALKEVVAVIGAVSRNVNDIRELMKICNYYYTHYY